METKLIATSRRIPFAFVSTSQNFQTISEDLHAVNPCFSIGRGTRTVLKDIDASQLSPLGKRDSIVICKFAYYPSHHLC